jgi:hypothetical protein
MLGGSIGFSSSHDKYDNPPYERQTSIFYISPVIGKAIKQNLILGFDLRYSYELNKTQTVDTSQTHSAGAGIFMRRYTGLGKNFYLFGEGRFGGSFFNRKVDAQPYIGTTKGFGLNLGFTPGVAYSLNNKLQLETSFNNLVYLNFEKRKATKGNSQGPYKTTFFSAGSSLGTIAALNLGLRVLINQGTAAGN